MRRSIRRKRLALMRSMDGRVWKKRERVARVDWKGKVLVVGVVWAKL